MNHTTTLDPARVSLEKLPPISGTAVELLRSLDDESLNAADLARRIGQDPVLAARLLKIVNSPFYGVSGRVSSLHDAVMVLGFSSVRRLALAASLSGAFALQPIAGVDPHRLWRHAFSAALCAQALARHARVAPDTAFVAGLLHDIGRCALLAIDPQGVVESLGLQADHVDPCAAETAVFGFDHAEFGARLLERWRLPEALIRAVGFHHRPDLSPTEPLTDLIALANSLAHQIENDTPHSLIDAGEPGNALVRLQLTRKQCLEALAGVPDQIEALAAAIQ